MTVFVHTLGTGDPTSTARARCALRRFRTLRHPNILGYLDSLEVGTGGDEGGGRTLRGLGIGTEMGGCGGTGGCGEAWGGHEDMGGYEVETGTKGYEGDMGTQGKREDMGGHGDMG